MRVGESSAMMQGRDVHKAFLRRAVRIDFFNNMEKESTEDLKGFIFRIQEEINLRERQERERYNYNI